MSKFYKSMQGSSCGAASQPFSNSARHRFVSAAALRRVPTATLQVYAPPS